MNLLPYYIYCLFMDFPLDRARYKAGNRSTAISKTARKQEAETAAYLILKTGDFAKAI